MYSAETRHILLNLDAKVQRKNEIEGGLKKKVEIIVMQYNNSIDWSDGSRNKECDDINDAGFIYAINKKINNEINKYWMNTVEFDYAEFEKENGAI